MISIWLTSYFVQYTPSCMFGCLVIFFPNLPAAIRLKSFAVGISCGYCLASYEDGGWSDDPEMAPLENSPLGKLVMPILVRLLVSTPELANELANELAGSGVKIAMDNYPIIFHLFSFCCVCSSTKVVSWAPCGGTTICGGLASIDVSHDDID